MGGGRPRQDYRGRATLAVLKQLAPSRGGGGREERRQANGRAGLWLPRVTWTRRARGCKLKLPPKSKPAYIPAMQYAVVLIETEEGIAVSCPALPGCHSQGSTREEALANIREAIALWAEVAEEDAQRELAAEGARYTRELVTV
jgi:predicted RNase H-like HicB family nuclease